jgi:hypothetical protein
MATLAQQFGENTLDEPVSETIMRDVRLVRTAEPMLPRPVSKALFFYRCHRLTVSMSVLYASVQVARRLALVVMPGISSVRYTVLCSTGG